MRFDLAIALEEGESEGGEVYLWDYESSRLSAPPWMVAPTVAVTNRHVAQEFAQAGIAPARAHTTQPGLFDDAVRICRRQRYGDRCQRR